MPITADTITKTEFYALMMIYAANIDGSENPDELNVIKLNLGDDEFERVYAYYQSFNDFELINLFRDLRPRFITSITDEKVFLSEIKTVIAADHHIDIMERTLMLALRRIIRE